MINIITSFYISKYSSDLDSERSNELISALLFNINLDIVEKIHLFVDDEESLSKLNEITNSDKIKVIGLKKRPKYNDFFNYILENIPDKICMLINSDIYIKEYDRRVLELLNDNKYLFSITRHEHDFTCYWIDNYCGSHDCYIFNSKYLDKNIINEHTDFNQNLPGIESHIISTFVKNGFKSFNPCLQIKIIHLHKTNLRSYGEKDWIGLHAWNTDFRHQCWFVAPCHL